MPMPITITPTEIPDVLVIETGLFRDERGFFSESYSQPIWAEHGFNETFVQDNLSMSVKGALRGMHYQLDPHGMGKLVRVIRGAVFDVAVDLRDGSPTFGQWVGRELTGDNGWTYWIPVGFAHGFVALEDDTLVHYKCTGTHTPEAERSLSYACPKVGIAWPIEPGIVSKKDTAAPTLDACEHNFTYNA